MHEKIYKVKHMTAMYSERGREGYVMLCDVESWVIDFCIHFTAQRCYSGGGGKKNTHSYIWALLQHVERSWCLLPPRDVGVFANSPAISKLVAKIQNPCNNRPDHLAIKKVWSWQSRVNGVVSFNYQRSPF